MWDYTFIGVVCGAILQIVLCITVIGACVGLCCWCRKRYRKRRHPHTPAPPVGFSSFPNYYPAPVSPPNSWSPAPSALPLTSAPPSYEEAMSQRSPQDTGPPPFSQQPMNTV